jgi:hypothetical protein
VNESGYSSSLDGMTIVEGRALLHLFLVFSVSLGELRYGSVESITWSLRLRI